MTISLQAEDILRDLLCCLGSGLLVAALHDVACFLFGDRRSILALLDLSAFSLAAVLECSFAASASASGIPRWYMTAGLVCGAMAYVLVITPAGTMLRAWLVWLVRIPAALLQFFLVAPVEQRALALLDALQQKKLEKNRRKNIKRLQKHRKMVYTLR